MKGTFPLAPGSVLGLMGGGQLGRMFSRAASTMGYKVLVLEQHDCPAGEVSFAHVDAAYTDKAALQKVKDSCAAVTTEFENVPADALETLAGGQDGCLTAPAASCVRIAQDRLDEKTFLKNAGIPVAPHLAVSSEKDIDKVTPDLFPGILKTRRLGYDGKGQVRVRSAGELRAAFSELKGVPCILEKMLPLTLEVSVIVARGLTDPAVSFPVCENRHQNGILAQTTMPARISPELAAKARAYAQQAAEAMDYRGVLCVEFFVLADGTLVANEMAPRPHNSGHATIEACVTSQYEEQVRAMAGLPMGDTAQIAPAVMLNILGDVWFDESGNKKEPDWAAVLAVPGAKLHLYGKAEARRARKMGHVTVLGATVGEALTRAKTVARILKMTEPV